MMIKRNREEYIKNLKSIVEEFKNELEERNRYDPICPNQEIKDACDLETKQNKHILKYINKIQKYVKKINTITKGV